MKKWISSEVARVPGYFNGRMTTLVTYLWAMSQEKEFYSKVCVAGSIKFVVGEATEEYIQLSDLDKFSCNLATILTRDREVAAVNLKILPNKCKVYIAKNNACSVENLEYLNNVKEILINVFKDAPITFQQALNRNDMKDLSLL
ncbi:3379_t:CDS:1 [Diversispora eburnea]|uniref:3379_t:CDS:1 n=1 Tax=Diversispora eburnea TaxID=1213867 RepID=A0A9N8WJ87_9GLOM|nr:3379_t:CDS:1 [Diversispora eburnea]